MQNLQKENERKIDLELCENFYTAPAELLDIVENKYKNGFTISQVYNKEIDGISTDLINWCYYNLPLTEYDKALCIKHLKIVNCDSFYFCYNIKNCSKISKSRSCEDSEYVTNSDFIKNCSKIFNSIDVQNSEIVFDSEMVLDDSHYIFNSAEVYSSEYVSLSTNVSFSFGVAHSKNIERCGFITEVENVENVYFSREIRNSKNKLFCYAIADSDEPMIFNKKVSQARFDTTKALLVELLANKPFRCTGEIKRTDSDTNLVKPTLFPSIVVFYQTFKEDKGFWRKLSDNIGEYNADLLYKITLVEDVYKID